MNTKNSVLVLLSTYNGEKYLPNLLESVLNQKSVKINLLIRDDGSTDNTKKIIKEYSKKYKNIDYYFGENIGYAKSFWDLLKTDKEYDYYSFCDQDDIWLEDKMYKAINLLKNEDDSFPLLYTSNVIPVDENLKKIGHNTFNENRVLNIYESFQKNILPGCTFVFNNEAKKIASKYNGYMESHDWALYCIVKVFGKVLFDSYSGILYRISSQNTIGQDSTIKSIKKRIKRFFRQSKCCRSRFAMDMYSNYKDLIPNTIKNDIYSLGNYKNDLKCKLNILFSRNFRGIIFKLYIMLNRV